MVHVFTQPNLKQGLKIFGNAEMKANKSEMHQMHNKVVFHPIKGEQLTKKQKNGSLQVLLFLKKNDAENKRPRRRRRMKAKRRIKNPTYLTNSGD